MDGEERRAGVHRHQHPSITVKQERRTIAEGTLFETLKQNAQLTGHHIANQHPDKVTRAIFHHGKHVNVESQIVQSALSGGLSESSGTLAKSEK